MTTDKNKRLERVLSFLRWFIRQAIDEPIKVAKSVVLVIMLFVFPASVYGGVKVGTDFGELVFGSTWFIFMAFVMLQLIVRYDRTPD